MPRTKKQPKTFDVALTPYAILGVWKDCGPDVLTEAWRSLSRSMHPDRFVKAGPGAVERATTRFAALSEAHALLSQPHLAQAYNIELMTRSAVCDRCNGTGCLTRSVSFLASTTKPCARCLGCGRLPREV